MTGAHHGCVGAVATVSETGLPTPRQATTGRLSRHELVRPASCTGEGQEVCHDSTTPAAGGPLSGTSSSTSMEGTRATGDWGSGGETGAVTLDPASYLGHTVS